MLLLLLIGLDYSFRLAILFCFVLYVKGSMRIDAGLRALCVAGLRPAQLWREGKKMARCFVSCVYPILLDYRMPHTHPGLLFELSGNGIEGIK
jgi:hypothetical protein